MTVITDSQQRMFDLEARLETREAELRDMATMGSVITSIHEIESVLSVVLDMAIPLINGEVGIIMLEEEGELHQKVSWGITEEFVKTLKFKNNLDLPTYCFKSHESILLSGMDVTGDSGTKINSIICCPLKTSTTCFGVVVIINKADGTNYTDADKSRLETLMNYAAVAIHNSLLLKEQLEKQKIEQEIMIARQIQETILPSVLDDINGAEIGVVYKPAREVGGDFYEIIKVSNSEFVVIIGDVSDKGIPAALVMSAASGIIKTLLATNPQIEISKLASELNNLLADSIIKDREMFVTLFFARFDLQNGTLTYCNAGHLPGLFWDDQSQEIVELPEGGTIVGQFAGTEFKQGSRSLLPGDRLFVFTDGLTEAEDKSGQLFGREQARELFKSHIALPPKQFCDEVKVSVDKYSVGSAIESHDDFTIMQVKVG